MELRNHYLMRCLLIDPPDGTDWDWQCSCREAGGVVDAMARAVQNFDEARRLFAGHLAMVVSQCAEPA